MNPLKPIFDYIDKARSHVYGIFLFWVSVAHLPVIFTSIFVDQKLIYQKTKMLKNEYIHHVFFNSKHWWFWLVYPTIVFVFAGAMTWLMIWKLPKNLIKKAYNAELDAQYDREFMKVAKEEELNQRKAELAKKELKVVQKEETLAEKQEELENKEQATWLKEYDKFKQLAIYTHFGEILESLYTHNGYTRYNSFKVDSDMLAYAEGNSLIDVDRNNNKIEPTQKGKFFITQYQLDNS